MDDITIRHPAADELDLRWEGPLVSSETRCAHCMGPTQMGKYVWIDRVTGEPVSDPILGLFCPKDGPLNTEGFQLMPPDQVD